MAKASTGSDSGTGGMNTKLLAAAIATRSGADMVIANSRDIKVIHRVMEGRNIGTWFKADRRESFDLVEFVEHLHDEKNI